jgi:hypothetical protein
MCLLEHPAIPKRLGSQSREGKKDYKSNLLAHVAALDRTADSTGLDEDGWALRYFLEDQLVGLDRVEEEY